MTKTIKYSSIPEFEKDFKKLEKRYGTLSDDFENMKKNLLEVHYVKGSPLPPNTIVDIEGLCGETYKSKKVRKFACKSLKNLGNRSGIRVIFVLESDDLKITFIEIYHKSDHDIENKERLKNFIKTMCLK
jgi:mRNA-degrading endonuclease RelE of RelBE toxin-antitoxin system